MSMPTEGTIEAAEKIAQLVLKAPAGGIFHEAAIDNVAGIEVPGYAGYAGFSIRIPSTGYVFEVVVHRVR